MKVSELMESKLVTTRPDRPVSDLAELFLRVRVTGVPVLDDERLVGIVSRSDLVRQLDVEQSTAESAAFELEPFDAEQIGPEDLDRVASAVGRRWSQLVVADIMRRDVITTAPNTSIRQAAQLMVEHRIHRLLVVEGTQLVGLLSTLDILGAVANGSLDVAR